MYNLNIWWHLSILLFRDLRISLFQLKVAFFLFYFKELTFKSINFLSFLRNWLWLLGNLLEAISISCIIIFLFITRRGAYEFALRINKLLSFDELKFERLLSLWRTNLSALFCTLTVVLLGKTLCIPCHLYEAYIGIGRKLHDFVDCWIEKTDVNFQVAQDWQLVCLLHYVISSLALGISVLYTVRNEGDFAFSGLH